MINVVRLLLAMMFSSCLLMSGGCSSYSNEPFWDDCSTQQQPAKADDGYLENVEPTDMIEAI